MVTKCTQFEQNRPTPISKPTTLSQAEALNYSRGTLVFVTFNMAAFVYILRALVLTPFLANLTLKSP